MIVAPSGVKVHIACGVTRLNPKNRAAAYFSTAYILGHRPASEKDQPSQC